jgi:HEAT repeat protein
MGEAAIQYPDAYRTLSVVMEHAPEEELRWQARELLVYWEIKWFNRDLNEDNYDFIVKEIQYLKDPRWRRLAVGVLGRMGKAALHHPDVLPVLVNALRDPDAEVRYHAAEVLEAIGEAVADYPEVLPALKKALRGSDKHVRHYAAKVWGKVAKVREDRTMLLALMGPLRERDQFVRSGAVEAISDLGCVSADPGFLAYLVDLLRDEDQGVRSNAAWVLAQMGTWKVRIFLNPQKGWLRKKTKVIVRQVEDLSEDP